jgi:hypothetical protein
MRWEALLGERWLGHKDNKVRDGARAERGAPAAALRGVGVEMSGGRADAISFFDLMGDAIKGEKLTGGGGFRISCGMSICPTL